MEFLPRASVFNLLPWRNDSLTITDRGHFSSFTIWNDCPRIVMVEFQWMLCTSKYCSEKLLLVSQCDPCCWSNHSVQLQSLMVVDVTLYFLLPGKCQVVGLQCFPSSLKDRRLLDYPLVTHWINCVMSIEYVM